MARSSGRGLQRSNKIFVSWSGPNSKEFAKGLKNLLEKCVFSNTDLECFVSDQDIASGSDWWNKIKKELRKCKLGILCITKENLRAPWIHFEAGAMVAREVPSIPLLVGCSANALSTTPLNGKQAVYFYDQKKFLKMLVDINNTMGYGLSEEQITILGKEAYIKLKEDLSAVFRNLRDLRTFNDKYVYPNEVTNVKRNTIYISAPMSSIDKTKYSELRSSMLAIKKSLQKIGFTEVFCPLIDIESPEHFDGKAKAIKDNFPLMKQVDSMLVVYPWKNASSSLVEIGYGIALTKKMVVFHHEGLPYIIADAGSSIAHVKTYSFNSYNEINKIIEINEMALFEDALDEQ